MVFSGAIAYFVATSQKAETIYPDAPPPKLKNVNLNKVGVSLNAPEGWKISEEDNIVTFTDERESILTLRIMDNENSYEDLIKQIDNQANKTFEKIFNEKNKKQYRLEALNRERFYDPKTKARGYYYSGRIKDSHRTLFTGFFMLENKVCYFKAESLNNEFNKRLFEVYEKSIKSIMIE